MTATLQIKKDRPNYYILVRYFDEEAGKKRQKWITTDIPVKGNNKRKAEQRLKEVIAELQHNQIDIGKDILFVVFMREWLDNLKHSIAPTTYDGYSLVFNTHIKPFYEIKKLKVRELTPLHIQQYVNAKIATLSPNTVIKHLRNISKCLDSAVKQNLIAYNPVKRIDMPKTVKYTGAQHYNEKQIEKLLECSKGDPLEVVILLAVFYGLRRSEVLGLKWSAIDFENDLIVIRHTVTTFTKDVYKLDATKTDSSCTVLPLTDLVKHRLLDWKAKQEQYKIAQPNDYVDSEYVCTYPDGRLLRPNFVSHHFNLLLERNNLSVIRFHDLRHSSANYLKYLGFDLKDIQTWLRHGDIQTTMNIYTKLDMSAKRNIANKLNAKFTEFES